MSIRAEKLEEAIEYRDRLRDLLVFKKGFEDWKGPIECSFGSYKAVLSPCAYDAVMAALVIEEKMLRNTLEIWDVELPE